MKSHHAHAMAARHLRLRPLAFSLLCMGLAPALAQTLPSGFRQIAGEVAAGSEGGVMNITQRSARAVAGWTDFSIGEGGRVNILQPGQSSVLLNRVTSATPSTIAGAITANGHVYLINPNGILFTRTSSISVGGLIASTLNVDDNKFMQGGNLVFTRSDDIKGAVINQGTITATAPVVTEGPIFGNVVALMGETVRNEGTINVAQGSIGLISARTVNVDFNGDGLTTFTIPADTPATKALVENAAGAALNADGGRIQIAAASSATEQVVNLQGVVRARSTIVRDGQIVLGATGGDGNEMRLGASIDATGPDFGRNGGTISATAGVLTIDGATIDASGRDFGGAVTLEGTAGLTMSSASAVRANGSEGFGGNIRIGPNSESTALPTTTLAGTVEATGFTANTATGLGFGGVVTVNAGALTLDGATIDVSGTSFGGDVTILGKTSLTMTGESAIRANASEGFGGTIRIGPDAESTLLPATTLSGRVEAIGSSSGNSATDEDFGGTVSVNAGALTLDSLTMDASGRSFGGTVNGVGQSSLGMSANSVIRANGTQGAGGSIRLGPSSESSASPDTVLSGRIEATGGGNTDGGYVQIDAGTLRLDGLTIDVSGSGFGGGAVLTGTRGLAMSPTSSILANGANGEGGYIYLNAPQGLVHVSGALNAKGAGVGGDGEGQTDAGFAGGDIQTSGSYVEVGEGATINASGDASGGPNGTWAVRSSMDVTVSPTAPAYRPASYASDNSASIIGAGALGTALNNATDIEINSDAAIVAGRSPGLGVTFAEGAKVQKTQGPSASLAVNSARSIRMNAGSAIQSSAGALAIDFNVDAPSSQGGDLAALVANGPTDPPRQGAILLQGATIESNGGDILFYGQYDPFGGRAIGAYSADNSTLNGVAIRDSLVSTCAQGAVSCATGGMIEMGGQGMSQSTGTNSYVSGAGVLVDGSTIRTGTGDVYIDGVGGLGASGIEVHATSQKAVIESTSGLVGLYGVSPSRDIETDAPGTYTGVARPAGPYVAIGDAAKLQPSLESESVGSIVMPSAGSLEVGTAPDAGSTLGRGIRATTTGDLYLNATLSAQGAGSGNGGSIVTQGAAVFVSADTEINATGGATGGNGKWVVQSARDILVNDGGPVYNGNSSANVGSSTIVNAGVLGRTLGSSTDVDLNSDAVATANGSLGRGVIFDANVEKAGGGASTLTVNSVRDITQNADIRSTAGALNVNFNADAKGDALADSLPIVANSSTFEATGGAIVVSGASIYTNGGSIRFYGQSDADKGRAIGSQTTNFGVTRNGITIDNGTLSTCAQGPCDLPGDIILRGQGSTYFNSTTYSTSGVGIEMLGASLQSGTGAITVDGRGGLGANGVILTDSEGVTSIRSASGNIAVTGTSMALNPADPRTIGSLACDCFLYAADGSGVLSEGTTISTGGAVAITGIGASMLPSSGVVLSDTDILAGSRQTLSVKGRPGAGGPEITLFATGESPQALVLDYITPNAGVYVTARDRTIRASGGTITIDGDGGDVSLNAGRGFLISEPPTIDPESPTPPLIDVASTDGVGGTVTVTGRNIAVTSAQAHEALIDAQGAGGGGSISVLSTNGAINIDQNVGMRADATNAMQGNGGTIKLLATNGSVRDWGTASARGSTAGGDGGLIETSGSAGIDVQGFRANASATAGKAGTWLIDPYDIDIVHGQASGVLNADGSFTAVGDATIQDGDINNALSGGTSVAIATGTGGPASTGTIEFGRLVNIDASASPAPVTFKLDAAHDILARTGDTIIQSNGQPMNVAFTAGTFSDAETPATGLIDFTGQIYTNGGEVAMTAPGSIALAGVVDTRAGRVDTGAGGKVTLTVPAGGSASNSFAPAAIDLSAQISSSTGDVVVDGNSGVGTGVRVQGGQGGGMATTTGAISVTGVAGFSSNSFTGPSDGVTIEGATLQTAGGSVLVRGTRPAGGANGGAGVSMIGGSTISAAGGNVIVDGNSAVGTGVRVQGSEGGGIATTTGAITVTGVAGFSSNSFDGPSDGVTIDGATLQTAGGTVLVRGTRQAGGANGGAGVNLIGGSTISTATGDVVVNGTSGVGTGVRVQGGGIATTTGALLVTGIAAGSANSADGPSDGVTIDGAGLTTTGGAIAVRGLRPAGGTNGGAGVNLIGGGSISTTGAGDIDVAGEAAGNGGAGLFIAGGQPADPESESGEQPASSVSGGRNVVLRASNDGSSDAIVIEGNVTAANVLNLRPGGVDASGVAADRTADAITLVGTNATGYAISGDELTRMQAATVVVGSNTHAGNIDVQAAMASSVPLTLQNGGGGNISLHAPISAPTLGLVSGGNIAQDSGASITAGSLLATSSKGNVSLLDPGNNVSANTLAGGAAGKFEFANAGDVRIGSVLVTGYDAASNAPNEVSSSSMAADTVLVRSINGNLYMDSNVTSTTSTDLVAAGTFQNAEGRTITGGPFRIWANTWVGEVRGGIVGSGDYPNFYSCAYLGTCAVSETLAQTAGDNHFIYAQQPLLNINIQRFVREFGKENPEFTYTLDGLILNDRGLGISGSTSTVATAASAAGTYQVNGSFTSKEGYAINVVPGQLEILADKVKPPFEKFFTNPRVDVYRDEPTTWVYDRNIGFAPICVATGPLDTSRGAQEGDVLAREWSRVRTRPNLTSCVDTERHNGCADF